MKIVKMTVVGCSVAQIVVWAVILRPAYAPERIQQLFMILAAILNLIAAFKFKRQWITAAQFGQVAAISAWVLVGVVWSQYESEVVVGVIELIMSGLIALFIAPSLASLIALFFLKRSTDNNHNSGSSSNSTALNSKEL